MVTEKESLLIDCCIALGLSKEETKAIFGILQDLEQREEMLDWMAMNLAKHPKAVEVIIAAGEIQSRHKEEK